MRLSALVLAATLSTQGVLPATRADTAPAAVAPVAATQTHHPLIVVTFANVPKHPAGRAGTTGGTTAARATS